MRLYRKTHKKDLDVNIASLIDVILLLIIFFMTVSQITQTEAEPLDLPEAEQVQDVETETNKRVIINIRPSGEMIVYGEIVTLEQVADLLKEEKTQQSVEDIRVLIRADGTTQWKAVEQVVGVCRDEGLLRVRVAAVRKE